MKEMVYQIKRNHANIILDTGIYKNYEYIILNLGTHPCAYICIDLESKFFKKHYDKIPIEVHGGLTFSNNKLNNILEYFDKYKCDTLQAFKRDWIIGWDYAHYGDYSGYFPDLRSKKWTTQEIKKDIEYAINQLIRLEGEKNVE